MKGKLERAARVARHVGVRHVCPVCRTPLRSFTQVHPDDLPGARCPRCDALQRHRHLWLFLERELTPSGRVLHLAPEAGIERRLRRLPGVEYVSGDLEPGAAMLTLDLERLDLPDASFDWALCSHVLEHVADDGAAMRELHRVLRPGGTLVVQVPTYGPLTDEDPSLTDTAERRARFGQEDHVRMYGDDVDDRLRAAGFDVSRRVWRPAAREREKYGLDYRGVPAGFNESDAVWTVTVCRSTS
jgi:SAM-dependent methyltransferase